MNMALNRSARSASGGRSGQRQHDSALSESRLGQPTCPASEPIQERGQSVFLPGLGHGALKLAGDLGFAHPGQPAISTATSTAPATTTPARAKAKARNTRRRRLSASSAATPTWGSREALLKLPVKIARREGIGNLLAQGTRRAAGRFGDAARGLTAAAMA
jgi:hypothetical protein